MSEAFCAREWRERRLTFEGVIEHLRDIGKGFKDKRQGKNTQHRMEDVVLSAFSVFYLQCPSFLAYQQTMETEQGNNNARTLFGIEKIPSDNHIRSLLDEETPESLFPAFKIIFSGLEATGLLERMRTATGDLLMAFDGVEYHSSSTIHCKQCKTRKHKEDTITYSHGMVTAVLVKPGFPYVIDLPPEFTVPQDGHDKQDCETAAAKRWFARHAQDYQEYKVTVLGDDLYSHQPMCEAVRAQNFHFIFTCKPDSHKTLYEFVEGLKRTQMIEGMQVKRWTGKRHEIDQYWYVNEVPLRDGKDALLVNWFEIITTDLQGKILYRNAFVTDHEVNESTVASLVENGRTRWKTENENNNTLKRHGYNLEHNFGHGRKNLCNVFATLNLIAFLLHTVLEMTSEAYKKIRKKLGARKKFFEHLRTLTHYILFLSWDALLGFMMKHLKLTLDTT
jgi:hypothetical protein